VETVTIQTTVLQFITMIVNGCVALGVAYLTYRTAALSKELKEVKSNTDGLASALVASTAEASRAQGNVEGRAELKAEVKEAE
jgi:hypothetical protein